MLLFLSRFVRCGGLGGSGSYGGKEFLHDHGDDSVGAHDLAGQHHLDLAENNLRPREG